MGGATSAEPEVAAAAGVAGDADAGSTFGPPPQYPIESVDNALRLLLLLTTQPRIRLTDASARLGVASSTAHRLLAMLQYRGFVRRDAVSRTYVPGPAFRDIVAAANLELDVHTRARPVVERLHHELGHPVQLARLEGDRVHVLDRIEADAPRSVVTSLGRPEPAYLTPTGRAMLSRVPVDQLHRLYPDATLQASTAPTDGPVRTRTQLERELRTIRRRGFAAGEDDGGVVAVAVPVVGPAGTSLGLTAWLPGRGSTQATRATVASALKAASAELTDLLA